MAESKNLIKKRCIDEIEKFIDNVLIEDRVIELIGYTRFHV